MRVERPIGLRAPLSIVPNADVARLKRSDSMDRGPRRGDVTKLKECPHARWIEPPELSAYRTTEGLAEIVAAAAALLEQTG